jgi:probable addiction module antidote protein
VVELRIDTGPGYRAYFVRRGRELILLLAGGDKGSQRRAIAMARHLAMGLEEPTVTKNTRTTRYDVAEHLRSSAEMAAYLEAVIEESGDDATAIAKALGDVARARGMSQVARAAGRSRESLYKALSGDRSPDFDTILRVLRALGLRLHAEAVSA